jgi:hypothetical protein
MRGAQLLVILTWASNAVAMLTGLKVFRVKEHECDMWIDVGIGFVSLNQTILNADPHAQEALVTSRCGKSSVTRINS